MKEMIFSQEECERFTTVAGKVNFIIPTSDRNINFLMLSIFSLLLRSKPNNLLEHFNVVLSGPDKRVCDTSIYDNKQFFLEELRELKWFDKDMPITLIRVWSRVGKGRVIEMAVPWVHTQYFAYLHDDALMCRNWEEAIAPVLEKPRTAIVYPEKYSLSSIYIHTPYLVDQRSREITLPYISSPFILCDKPILKKLGTTWCDYNLSTPRIIDEDSRKTLIKCHNSLANLGIALGEYDYVKFNPGAWPLFKVRKHNYKVRTADLDITHFNFWSVRNKRDVLLWNKIQELENELVNYEQYWNLYQKYKIPF